MSHPRSVSRELSNNIMSFLDNKTNLIFAGGGVKGIAYVGAITALEELNLLSKVKRVGGTSAGAITALLLALGLNSKEILKELLNLDLEAFLDDDRSRVKKDTLLGIRSASSSKQSSTASKILTEFSENLGIYPGRKVRAWLKSVIEKNTLRPECTFSELHDFASGARKVQLLRPNCTFRELAVVGFNLNTKSPFIFSYETTPNAVIADAVRISMSIPFLFSPWKYIIKDPASGICDIAPGFKNAQFIDGGIGQNYPIHIFDCTDSPKSCTLGFYLTSEDKKTVYECGGESAAKNSDDKTLDTAWDFTVAVLQSGMYNTLQRNQHLAGDDGTRTIYISNCGVNTLAFNLSVEDKNRLIESGWKSVQEKVLLSASVQGEIPPCPLVIPTTQ